MIENLKKVLKQEDTILFIGSGISLWSNLPSWTGLIHELIDFIKENGLDASLTEQELKRGDLLQAASYGFDKLTKQYFAQFIRKACRVETSEPHDIHKKIIALGPTCYVTTNYDKLLEKGFQKWKSDTYFRTVVNTQLTETAEIVGARAIKFLFKLHGDVENSDSIILTREQYRALNTGGELNHALETAKTLMLSRPIVYIGFGLRDPDFLYLKDLIINTYKGGSRDHYAIMADVNEQEKDYWRRNFGIHLIDYQTIINSDGKRDHSPILTLLDSLKTTEIEAIASTFVLNSEFILNLNRHSAKYSNFEASKLHFPLIVHPIANNKIKKKNFQFYESPVEKLLDNGPEKFILIGLPGSGKSYSLKSSVSRLSEKLSKACIDDAIKINETIVPVYVDLKLYEGNILELIEQNIPIGINLSLLCLNFKVKLYLDAFNEIPKEYIESKKWSSDFSKLLEKYKFSFVISSRTIDGLEELEFPCFNIDSISKEFIKTSLSKKQLELTGTFRNEMINLLQKPFFYKLVFENKFKIESETRPQKIYLNLINTINQKFNERFSINLNLFTPLSSVAMKALDNGEEAFKIELFKNYIELELKKFPDLSISSSDIVNWLVSQDFIIPLINERISFFHQTITEYLAATKLASLFIINNNILEEKLRYRRWDQALFLCLSLLTKEEADKFLETVIKIDFELALSAVKYLEEDTNKISERLLKEINKSSKKSFEWENQIGHKMRYNLPIEKSHIPVLKKIIKKGNNLGGYAACCLIDLQGVDIKKDILNLFIKHCDDYNFCSEIARNLKKYITEDDIDLLLHLTKKVQKKIDTGEIKKFDGFASALGEIMSDFAPRTVFNTFYSKEIKPRDQSAQVKVIYNFIGNSRNNESLKISTDLLLLGISEFAFKIYFILSFSNETNIEYSIFETKHIDCLLSITLEKESKNSSWALSSLKSIFTKREDLKSYIEKNIEKTTGVLKAALHYAVSEHDLVFQSLEGLLKADSKKINEENFDLISRMDHLNWVGNEKLFIDLLKLKNEKLAYNLCDKLALFYENNDRLIFDIGPINWWLEWFREFFESKSKEWMFIDRVPSVIVNYVPKEKRQEFVLEFNYENSHYREIINKIIFRKINDLKLEDFTEEALSYLIKKLKSDKIDIFNHNILIDIANEKFVSESLLPLFKDSVGIERDNLELAIEKIGKKHKRRYLI